MSSSRSENLVILIGNLTRDPRLRYTSSGAAVADFGVATNRVWNTPEGQQKEEVEFHQVVVWNKLAEICNQILNKGDKVYIRGSLKTRTWADPNGTKHYRTEIRVEDMKLLHKIKGREDEEEILSDSDGIDDIDFGPLDDDSSKDKKKADKKEKPEKKDEEEEEIDSSDLPF